MHGAEVREAVEVQARALGPLLHSGMAASLEGARARNVGLKHSKYPHLVPSCVRAELREFLESSPVPSGWRIGGNSRRMGQLDLENPDLGMSMRFLKERRRTYPGGVPTAGHNQARRQRWTSLPLDFPLPQQVNTDVDTLNLLLLWDFRKPGKLDEFRLRIVHTLAPGTYGKPVPCDLIVDVEDGGFIFSQLKFAGSPEDDDLFKVEIAEEDNGS